MLPRGSPLGWVADLCSRLGFHIKVPVAKSGQSGTDVNSIARIYTKRPLIKGLFDVQEYCIEIISLFGRGVNFADSELVRQSSKCCGNRVGGLLGLFYFLMCFLFAPLSRIFSLNSGAYLSIGRKSLVRHLFRFPDHCNFCHFLLAFRCKQLAETCMNADILL